MAKKKNGNSQVAKDTSSTIVETVVTKSETVAGERPTSSMSVHEYKGELGDIKQNVKNLGECLSTVLGRIEQLEVIAPQVEIDDHDPNTQKHVHVEETEEIADDGTKIKRVHVTERVVTTKTFQTLGSPEAEYVPITNGMQPAKPGPVTVGYRKCKKNNNLGVKVAVTDGHLVVSSIESGSPVIKQGSLHVGDTILQVNGKEVKTQEALDEAWKAAEDQVTVKVVPSKHHAPSPDARFVRAMFDYTPSEDATLTTKEAGLAFKTGDVLHIVSSEDDKYWQARKMNDLSKIGMIPSKKLQSSRSSLVNGEDKKGWLSWLSRSSPDVGDGHVPSVYEEVARLSPYGRKVLVLIGAPGVGRRTLKSMLLAHDTANFATVTPYTSRDKREGEVEGREYHFVKKDGIKSDIDKGGYVEWGEYNGNLYGTSVQSVRDIIATGRVCVLDCSPQAARYLYSKEFMPYVVFVGPPSLEELKQLYQVHPNRTKNKTDESLQKTCEESAQLETQFRSLFDQVLVNRNVDVTFRRLLDALEALKTETQWVPSQWLQ